MTTYTMRAACAQCGTTEGYIIERGSQDVMRCVICDAYQYCAPRTETGKAVRTLASRPNIKPSTRARILHEHDYACVCCGRRAPDVSLDLGHLISRDDAARAGFLDDPLIDSEWNLAPMCQECNSGQRPLGTVSIRLIYRVLQLKEFTSAQGAA